MAIHLHVHSAFSFLDGTAYPDSIIEQASELGYTAIALTDHDNVCGAVRFVQAAKEAGVKPILGVELTTNCGHLTTLAMNAIGYENICHLLTIAYLHTDRRNPVVSKEALQEYSDGLIILSGCQRGEIPTLLWQGYYQQAKAAACWYQRIFSDRFFIEIQRGGLAYESSLNRRLSNLADDLKIPLVATNNVHYLQREDFPTHDILGCIRNLWKVDEWHPFRAVNAEQYLLNPQSFQNRFSNYTQALLNTDSIAAMCDDAVLPLKPELPKPVVCVGSAREYLRKLVFEGAKKRYGNISDIVQSRLNHELEIIGRVGSEPYFLMVWDIVQEAKRQGIRTSGRGSVVDSAVGHCLGISDIDPIKYNLRFERFMSVERSQLPDIDIDFPREKRDRLVAWLQDRHGIDHVGGVCTFSTFRARSALREAGKALGFPEGEISLLAKRLRGANADDIQNQIARQPQAHHQKTPAKEYTMLFKMCARIAGLPRHISTHLGGVVVTANPLFRYSPLMPTAKGVVRIVHFDKDDVESIALKTDLLSLPILGAVDNPSHPGLYDEIPDDDPETYAMIRAGEAIGAFELQSPAQRALHVKLQSASKKDIIDSIALIRPGPGMGGMVENYIRRKLGLEDVTYLHPSLEESLKNTYGVVIFQEQVLEVAIKAANFTPGEADLLRKMISRVRSKSAMQQIRGKVIQKALDNGLSQEAAEHVFKVVSSFVGYGFAEGHARAFGEIAYRSSYLLTHYPAHYLAGLLNNQPMGFYSPNTLMSQARARGITILPLDINHSDYFSASTDETIRIGFRQVKGMTEEMGRSIHAQAPFQDLIDFCRKCRPRINTLYTLIAAGAFDSIHPHRRALLWQAEEALKLARQPDGRRLLDVTSDATNLPEFYETELLGLEYGALGLNANCHLISMMRSRLDALGLMTTNDLAWIPGGQRVRVGGLTLCPHTPPTKSGKQVLFFCLEDEFGLIDVTCFENVYRDSGYLAFSEPLVIVEGMLQKRNLGRAILADKVKKIPRIVSLEEACTPLPEPRTHSIYR